ncbi:MAG: hypothetical protein SWZ49_28340 [Cyanobacteriota bacterium]|nr:hypothetical protein [Cyanobacteriota bacterium]
MKAYFLSLNSLARILPEIYTVVKLENHFSLKVTHRLLLESLEITN